MAGRIIWILSGGLAAVTMAGALSRFWPDGRVGWVLDLMSHWPKHLAMAGLVVGLIAGVRRMRIAAGVAALVVAVNGAMVVGLSGFALPGAASPGDRTIRVVSANVHGSTPALQNLAVEAAAYGADVVSIYEAPETLDAIEIAELFPDMPVYGLPSARADGRKLVRRSMLAARGDGGVGVTTFAESHGVILRLQRGAVQVVTTHPPSPGDPDLMRDRDVQLASIGEGLDETRPFVVLGDFNATPWGRTYGVVPGTRAGDPRFEGTFPGFLGPLGLPIDHIKFGGGLVLTDYRTGPDIGSDHLPLFATFALPASGNAGTR